MSLTINDWFMIGWGVVILLTLLIELGTNELVSIWFSAGAFVAFFFAIPEGQGWWITSIVVFLVVSGLMLALFEIFWKKKMDNRSIKTNSDSIIGTKVHIFRVLEDETTGLCKIGDVVWTVSSDVPLKEGTTVTISDIKGNKLITNEGENE